MKISMKISLGFGILIALVWIIGIVSITSFGRSSTLFNKMDTDTIPKLTAVGEMGQKVTQAHVEFMEFLLSGKLSARDNVSGIIGSLESLAQEHQKRETDMGPNSEGKKVADNLLAKIGLFASSVVEVMDMKTRGSSDEALLAEEEKTVRPTFDSMMLLLSAQNKTYTAELSMMRNDVKDAQRSGQLIIIIIAVLAMIMGLVLSIMTERRIAQPIKHLTSVAEDISRGEISKPVERESKDEIGDLAEAFERMRISLKVMIDEE